MYFAVDYITHHGAMVALEFAIDECDNRILEAIAAGSSRTAGAWELTKRDYQKTLDRIKNAKPVLETTNV
jgi:chemotaxis regulatin CheY-phosphate phosphatase CheZ